MTVPLKDIPDLKLGLDALGEAHEEYEKAEEYARGNSPQLWLDPAILNLLGGFPYVLNFARVPIDVYSSRISISNIQVQNDDDATKHLRQIWDGNEMDIEEAGIIRGVLTYGDYYLEVWENDKGKARITGCDPKCMRIIYSDEDDRTPLFAVKRWRLGPKELRADLRYTDRIEKYISEDDGKSWDEHEDEGDEGWPIDNPWNEIPVFHMRTDRPYGVPIHREAWGASDAITKIAQSHLGTADYLGLPQRVALVDPEDPRGTGTLTDFDDDRPGNVRATGQSGGMVVDAQGAPATPGELWAIRAKSVTEFKPAESRSFIESMKFYIGVAAQLTRVPLRFFADPQGQHPSGFSLRTADAPMRLASKLLEKSFAATIRRASAFALLIEETDKADEGAIDDIPVVVKWESPEISDSADEWAAAVEKLKAGVPQRQVFLDMGYTEEQCDSWGLTEKDAKAKVPQLFSGGSTIVSESEVMASSQPNPPELEPPKPPEPKIVVAPPTGAPVPGAPVPPAPGPAA